MTIALAAPGAVLLDLWFGEPRRARPPVASGRDCARTKPACTRTDAAAACSPGQRRGCLRRGDIPTAERRDDEMDARIDMHRARLPAHGACVGTPLALATALREHGGELRWVLVDCLTPWRSNLLALDDAQRHAHERDTLLDVAAGARCELLLVSNEVGLGIAPMGEPTRRFVDEAGRLHQALARQCERVVFTAAGLPLYLKGTA